MKVLFTLVGFEEGHHWSPGMVELDVLPREGEVVEIPGMPQSQVHVRTVVHYPFGDREAESSEPFAYVVLGPRRRD